MGAKPALAKEADCPTGELEQADLLDENEKETSVRKLKVRRTASPSILINRNGSRYISPLDIVRSEVGRAEILRQSQRKDSQRNGATKQVREDRDKGSIRNNSR